MRCIDNEIEGIKRNLFYKCLIGNISAVDARFGILRRGLFCKGAVFIDNGNFPARLSTESEQTFEHTKRMLFDKARSNPLANLPDTDQCNLFDRFYRESRKRIKPLDIIRQR